MSWVEITESREESVASKKGNTYKFRTHDIIKGGRHLHQSKIGGTTGKVLNLCDAT